jgi:nucleoside-triphosphatase
LRHSGLEPESLGARINFTITSRRRTMNRRKIFLTGEPGVGKSTIISKVVNTIGITPQGFNTLAQPLQSPVIPDRNHVILGEVPESTAQYNEGIYIVPYGDTPLRGMSPVGTRNRSERKVTAFPEIFDKLGVKILADSQGAGLIIMDELGFMESKALLFQQKVLQILNSDATVLGVIKPKQTPFLDAIRELSSVEVIEVTKNNRDDIPSQIISMLV